MFHPDAIEQKSNKPPLREGMKGCLRLIEQHQGMLLYGKQFYHGADDRKFAAAGERLGICHILSRENHARRFHPSVETMQYVSRANASSSIG